ncbi:MAG TPA: GH25 family lysozyme [Caproiciproducens sp.]|nr:GH25 family lysozyme [Caproiciproducens sp.]
MTERWIDVSAHNGVIDWMKVKASGVVGVVIRAGYGNDISQRDTQFLNNIKGALAAGLKVAIYWFSYADSVADALKEWAACRQIILPYRGKILFVASDYEYDSVNYYRRIHGVVPSNVLINQMVSTFLTAAKADGWGTALYTNNDYRRTVFSAATLAVWDIWLADYSGGPDVSCAMQQTGSTGNVPGISGNVDMNTCFKTYSGSVADPPYSCDTAGTVEIARGSAYQALITCNGTPQVVAGTADVATVLHRYDDGDKHYYFIVPIGRSGQETGIYINGGARQFVARVK